MTDLRAAAEMALEALEELAKLGNGEHYGNSDGNVVAQKAIPALRQALAQGEQEPVHFLANGVRYKVTHQGYYGCSIVGLPENLNGQWVALVEATDSKHLNCIAQQESTKPEQEPVAYWNGKDMFKRADEVQYVVNWTDYFHYPLYSEPRSCPTCESLARTVMMDQTSHDTTPPSKQEQEPVTLESVYETIIHWDEGGGKRSRRELARRITELYTTPVSKPWVSLTDEDIRLMCHNDEPEDWNDLRERQYWRVTYTHGAKAAQDELRSKNT